MNIEVSIKTRSGKYFAEGEYCGDSFIVKAGGYVSDDFAKHIQGGNTVKKYRDDRNYVSEDYKILKDCVFKSPSTAAMFVTGSSTNGYVAWKTNQGIGLGDFLEKSGLRRTKRNGKV